METQWSQLANTDFLMHAASIASTTLFLALALSLIIITIGTLKQKLHQNSFPPGPRSWPVIGNLHLLALSGKLPHRALADMARNYGPLMGMQLGLKKAVVASDAETVREILKTQNLHFASRAHTSAGEIMNYNRRNIVWAPDGDHLRAVKKIVQMQLLSNSRIASFQNVREEEVRSSVQSILEGCKGGTVHIVLDEMMSQLSTNNVSRMLFGKSLYGKDSQSTVADARQFMELVRGIFRLSGMFVIGDFIPFLRRFDIHGYEAKMTQLAMEADKFYSSILEEHRCSSNSIHKKGEDFVDTLLSLPVKDSLSDEVMKGVIADMIFAGTDTSANQVCWTFAELMRHPEILCKAQQELDSEVGRKRLVKEADIPQLKYLQAIIKESFRLHPVAGILLYESTADTHIHGYLIPAKTRIFVNNHAISRDPASWKDPLSFNPERFLVDFPLRDVKGQDFELLPFGSGRRMCIGMNLGLLMVQFTVAQLLHMCDWSLRTGMGPEDVDLTEDFGISTPLKTPLRLIATPRLPSSVLYG